MKDMPCLTNQFSVLERCTIGTNDMLHPIVTSDQTENPQAMPENPLPMPTAQMHSLAHAYVFSADTCCCIRISLEILSVETGHPLAVDPLLDSCWSSGCGRRHVIRCGRTLFRLQKGLTTYICLATTRIENSWFCLPLYLCPKFQ